jgi:cytochrome c biogenesis protein ResB
LLAAHAIRFKLAWNRVGIILIHAGIIIMMLGELVTGLYAIENQMMIREGQTVSNVVDIRVSELAIIHVDPNDPKTDHLVTIPANHLKAGSVIDDPKVPLKVEVQQFMVNSSMNDKDGDIKADRGFGKTTPVKERPEVSGVEGQKIDVPSAYVKLFDRAGKSLGTWLVSTHFMDPQWQWIEADGKKYKIALRFKQTTRPFTMHLTKFDHKVFEGTATPKDYRSHIHLIDNAAVPPVDREIEIYMNNPFHYRGETFYQSGMDKDDKTGIITTTLSVVRNPGWQLPYISCAVVGIGLLIHFGLTLYRFLEKRSVR